VLCGSRDLLSFPTRRSSDLQARAVVLVEGALPAGRPGAGEEAQDEPGPPRLARVLDDRAQGKGGAGPDKEGDPLQGGLHHLVGPDRKSTRLNSSHVKISYAV